VNKTRVIIGTRQSKLALWQAEYIAARLKTLYPELEVMLQPMVTHGDRVLDKPLPEIGGKGVFTAELEQALAAGEIDLAVHSLKDLPTEIDPQFSIGAIPERAQPYDVLVSRSGDSLMRLPAGATVGTSSLRRVAQIKAARPDLNTASLRGNVPTRIDKLHRDDSPYDAIVLAMAGLDRLDLESHITEILAPEIMLPAPAQGALAVQCRADDYAVLDLLLPLNHIDTRRAVSAERAFLNALDAGCRLPVAALAWAEGSHLDMVGRVCSLDGSQVITVQSDAVIEEAALLGKWLAEKALNQGADKLLAEVKNSVQSSEGIDQ
jgi:hydroxymethylbilane synthase